MVDQRWVWAPTGRWRSATAVRFGMDQRKGSVGVTLVVTTVVILSDFLFSSVLLFNV